jgi:hypothetical protein
MKKTKRPNPHIGRDALADVQARVARNPRLRARIDAAVEFEGVRTWAA